MQEELAAEKARRVTLASQLDNEIAAAQSSTETIKKAEEVTLRWKEGYASFVVTQ